MSKRKSDFGAGLTYCIGLFLAHAERSTEHIEPRIWFNGVSDHLYELDTSLLSQKDKLGSEIKDWAAKVFSWRHGFSSKPTEENIIWSIEKAKEFLWRIDKELLKVEAVRGIWE